MSKIPRVGAQARRRRAPACCTLPTSMADSWRRCPDVLREQCHALLKGRVTEHWQAESLLESSRWQPGAPGPPDWVDIEHHDPEAVVYFLAAHTVKIQPAHDLSSPYARRMRHEQRRKQGYLGGYWMRRVAAWRYLAAVLVTISAGSSGPGGVLSQRPASTRVVR